MSEGPPVLLPVGQAASPEPSIGTFLVLCLHLEPGHGPTWHHWGRHSGAPALCPHSPTGSVSASSRCSAGGLSGAAGSLSMQGHPGQTSSHPVPGIIRGRHTRKGKLQCEAFWSGWCSREDLHGPGWSWLPLDPGLFWMPLSQRGGSILPPAEPHHHPDKICGDGSCPTHTLRGKS